MDRSASNSLPLPLPRSKSRSNSDSNPQKRIKLTLSISNPSSDSHSFSNNMMNGGSDNGNQSNRRQRQTRMMDVKVLYTLDSNPQQTMVARLGSQAPIPLQHGPTSKNPERPWFGTITLKTCLSAICGASPELIFDRTRDYVLYAVDPIETYRSSTRSTNQQSQSSQPPSPSSSKYRQSSYLVGKSMFNWGLQEPGDGHTMVTGRVCLAGGRRPQDEEDYDSEDEELMSEEEEEEEILEVILKLKETESRSKEQYYDAVKGFSSTSTAKPSTIGSTSRSSKAKGKESKGVSSRIKEKERNAAGAVQTPIVEEESQTQTQTQSKTRTSKRRKVEPPQPKVTQAKSSKPKSNSRLSIRRTTSNPLQSKSSPGGSFFDASIGALATSSSPPFNPSRFHSASPAASTSTSHQQPPSQNNNVQPEQAEQLLHLLNAVSEQARQPTGSNSFQQNQAHLVQVLSSLAGALGAQGSPDALNGTSSTQLADRRNESERMPPPTSLPFASSSMTAPQVSNPTSLSSFFQNPIFSTSTTPQSNPPAVSLTAPSSDQHPTPALCDASIEPLFEAPSPQDWSSLLAVLDKREATAPPSPASASQISISSNPNNAHRSGNRGGRNEDEGRFGSSKEICYNCGITELSGLKGQSWTVTELSLHDEVNNPEASVNPNPTGKGKEKQSNDLNFRACKLCAQYKTRQYTNRPERIWRQKGSFNTNNRIPVFDFQDGNGGTRIGSRGTLPGGTGGKRFKEVGLNTSRSISKPLDEHCQSLEAATIEKLEKEPLEKERQEKLQKEKVARSATAKGKKRSSKTKASIPDPSPPKLWSTAFSQPGELPEPIFDTTTGERTRAFVQQSKPKSSSSSKSVHFGQSSPVRPSITGRATFHGISNSSPVGPSGSNNFIESSPGGMMDKFLSDCDYDFGSISFPEFGKSEFVSPQGTGIGNFLETGGSGGSDNSPMRFLRRSPRKLPGGTKNKNNPYASSIIGIPASPTFSLPGSGSNLVLDRHQGGGPASMDVLTSSVSPMTRSRTRSSNGGIHPAMLSSSMGKRPSNSGKKTIGGGSSDTSPGSPTPSSHLRSGGSRRSSTKRKAGEELKELGTPTLDLGFSTWTNHDVEEDDDEDGREGGLAQELDASPSSSRRNRRGSRSAQSSELSRGPSSNQQLGSSSGQRLRSGKVGGAKTRMQKNRDDLFNTSNPPGSSPSLFELSLQQSNGKSPASTTTNNKGSGSTSNLVTTPKKGTSKNAFNHLRKESWAGAAESPLWGGETPASERAETFVRPPLDGSSPKQSKIESRALTTQVQSQPPQRIPRKPLPATVEDAPSSSGGESSYDDDDEYLDQEPSPAGSGLYEGIEDPYNLLGASGIGLNSDSSQDGITISSDTFREAIELYASSQFGNQLRDFTQNGGTGIAAHVDPTSNNNQSFGGIQSRDGQAQIESSNNSTSNSNDGIRNNVPQLPTTPGRSRTFTNSNYYPTGLTPGMTPINISSFNQGINHQNYHQPLHSHVHSSTQASPGMLNSLLNDPSWKELLSSFASPSKPKRNGNKAQIMSNEEVDQEENNGASGSGNSGMVVESSGDQCRR